MKKLSKKSMLLFASVMALCAFAMPSMASAASWGTVGTNHVLDSSNLQFSAHTALGLVNSGCTASQFNVDVTSAAALRVTTASFTGCTSTGAAGHCTVTTVATGLPWTVTGPTTSNITIHGVSLDLRFETVPPSSACALNGQTATLTGSLNGGSWDAAAHQVTFSADSGLTLTSALGSSVATVTGTVRDTSQTLTLT